MTSIHLVPGTTWRLMVRDAGWPVEGLTARPARAKKWGSAAGMVHEGQMVAHLFGSQLGCIAPVAHRATGQKALKGSEDGPTA